MKDFLFELKFRNEPLFYFGLICLFSAIVFLIMTRISNIQLFQVNAWYKPFKFSFSTFLFSWAMAWYCYYLPSFNVRYFNWAVIILLGFEIIYIAVQAGLGKPSHYNISTPFHSMMFSMMALAATIVTLLTSYVGLLFFSNQFPVLPNYYVWSIRLGILIFVIFSFEGFLMGSRMSHSVGLENDNSELFIAGWSRKAGDLRISHFLGMHALQLIPMISFYLLKNTKTTLLFGILYATLTTFTLVQALQGRSLFPEKKHSKDAHFNNNN